MSEIRKSNSQPELRSDLVLELIDPEITYQGFGRKDSLSGYLYYPTIKSKLADTMIAFVHEAESYIDTEYPDSESNHLRIHRMLALVVDVPEELPTDETLRIWTEIFNTGWTVRYSNGEDLARAIRSVQDVNPALGSRVREELEKTIASKSDQLSLLAGQNIEVPKLEDASVDIVEALELFTKLQKSHPDLLPLYDTLLGLCLTSANSLLRSADQ